MRPVTKVTGIKASDLTTGQVIDGLGLITRVRHTANRKRQLIEVDVTAGGWEAHFKPNDVVRVETYDYPDDDPFKGLS